MKAIVKIKPSGKCLRRLLRHCYLSEGPQGREVEALNLDGNRVVETIYNGPGALTMRPALDAQSLGGDITTRGQYRHVVISAEETAGTAMRASAIKCLVAIAREFEKAFCQGTSFIAVAHDDRMHPHVHLIFKNERADGRCLSWSKNTVKSMQSFDWVDEKIRKEFALESGRGRGRNPVEYSDGPYPSPRLDAMKLAKASQKQLEDYERTGELTIARRSRRGEITSINYNGRRIRLSTIRAMAGLRTRVDSTTSAHLRRRQSKQQRKSRVGLSR